MDKDVDEGLSDNSKTITQPLDNAHSRPIYVEKFTSQVPSCGYSMEDSEEIDSYLCPFHGPLDLELQLYEKSERCKLSSKDKKSGSKCNESA